MEAQDALSSVKAGGVTWMSALGNRTHLHVVFSKIFQASNSFTEKEVNATTSNIQNVYQTAHQECDKVGKETGPNII